VTLDHANIWHKIEKGSHYGVLAALLIDTNHVIRSGSTRAELNTPPAAFL
jgi:hypothetical protein